MALSLSLVKSRYSEIRILRTLVKYDAGSNGWVNPDIEELININTSIRAIDVKSAENLGWILHIKGGYVITTPGKAALTFYLSQEIKALSELMALVVKD